MPLGATFDPQYQASGRTANRYIEGLDAGSSLMDRAQARRLREQENARRQQEEVRQQAEFQAKLPLLKATADTAVINAAAAVANATQKEILSGKAAASSVDYNERFQNILTIADVQDKADTLAAFQAEVAWLDNPLLPDYKGFAATVNNARASAATMALTNMKLDEALDRAAEANAASIERTRITAGASVERAGVTAAGRQGVADTAAASRDRVEAVRTAGRITQEQVRGQNAANRQGDSIKHLEQLAADADQDAADASARGDEQAAAVHRQVASSYRDGVQKATTFAGQSPLKVPEKSPAGGRATPPKGKEIESQPMTVTVPGVTPAASAAPVTPAPAKLYVVDAATKVPALAPNVKTPQDILSAVQQMVDDGVMDADAARATLTKMGFRPKR